jgi:hypothetical protein
VGREHCVKRCNVGLDPLCRRHFDDPTHSSLFRISGDSAGQSNLTTGLSKDNANILSDSEAEGMVSHIVPNTSIDSMDQRPDVFRAGVLSLLKTRLVR